MSQEETALLASQKESEPHVSAVVDSPRISILCRKLLTGVIEAENAGLRCVILSRLPSEPEKPAMGFVFTSNMVLTAEALPNFPDLAKIIQDALTEYKQGSQLAVITHVEKAPPNIRQCVEYVLFARSRFMRPETDVTMPGGPAPAPAPASAPAPSVFYPPGTSEPSAGVPGPPREGPPREPPGTLPARDRPARDRPARDRPARDRPARDRPAEPPVKPGGKEEEPSPVKPGGKEEEPPPAKGGSKKEAPPPATEMDGFIDDLLG